MDVFNLRERLTRDYASYAGSFIQISDPLIAKKVEESLAAGAFWPDALIQLNPTFIPGGTVHELVQQNRLHPECDRVFLKGKDRGEAHLLQLYQHQLDAIRVVQSGENYILTTGTGSGKSLAYIVPIVDHVLRQGSGRGIQAIIVYPMNALANSQAGELKKFLQDGYPDGQGSVTFARYTGQENEEQRQAILAHPPNILLTNYVMLELIMTRPRERKFIERARGLRFLVLDELHTYRGRQGADVALLMRRVRDRLDTGHLQFVGTSATLANEGTATEQQMQVIQVGTQMFGVEVKPEHVIMETLQRATPECDPHDPYFVQALTQALADGEALQPPTAHAAFVAHPLSQWIEAAFGVSLRDGWLVRSQPRSIRGEHGVAHELSTLIGLDEARCELDALYFHLYGIARDDVDYIMETFPIVKRRDEAACGEYRTKRVILEMYDAMANGLEHYVTRLDPPPADPRVAHPD